MAEAADEAQFLHAPLTGTGDQVIISNGREGRGIKHKAVQQY